jgi:hypothetical protein
MLEISALGILIRLRNIVGFASRHNPLCGEVVERAVEREVESKDTVRPLGAVTVVEAVTVAERKAPSHRPRTS